MQIVVKLLKSNDIIISKTRIKRQKWKLFAFSQILPFQMWLGSPYTTSSTLYSSKWPLRIPQTLSQYSVEVSLGLALRTKCDRVRSSSSLLEDRQVLSTGRQLPERHQADRDSIIWVLKTATTETYWLKSDLWAQPAKTDLQIHLQLIKKQLIIASSSMFKVGLPWSQQSQLKTKCSHKWLRAKQERKRWVKRLLKHQLRSTRFKSSVNKLIWIWYHQKSWNSRKSKVIEQPPSSQQLSNITSRWPALTFHSTRQANSACTSTKTVNYGTS